MPTTDQPLSQTGGLKWLRRGCRYSTTRFVGVDIGVDRIHIAAMGAAGKSGAVSWRSRSEIELPIEPFEPPPHDWVQIVAATLRQRMPRCVDGEKHLASIALPPSWIHYETTSADNIEACRSQCNAMYRASIFQSDAHLNHWPIAAESHQHVVAAVSEPAASEIAEAITGVGYSVQNILPHGAALALAAASLTSIQPHSVVLLELSGGVVAMLSRHGCGLCRAIPACRPRENGNRVPDEIEPWLRDVAREIDATSRFASRLGGIAGAESPVLICGQIAEIPGVDDTLAALLNRPVATWRYSGKTRPRSSRRGTDSASDSDPRRAVAISLAYAGAVAEMRGDR